jgi:hypothetical protein
MHIPFGQARVRTSDKGNRELTGLCSLFTC